MKIQNAVVKNWKQEPLVWMLIAIPFSAVVMGVVMITLAIQSDSGLVIDDYYRHGKEINRVLERDQRAHQLGMTAQFTIAKSARIEIRLAAAHAFDLQQKIELKLIHATRPGLDQHLHMKFVDGLLTAQAQELAGKGRWNLFLQTREWRLTGSLQVPAQQNAELLPNYFGS